MRVRMLLLAFCALACLAPLRAANEAAYRLGPRDELTVTVARHAELTQDYVVPPDGAVEFLRVGRIVVANRTIGELIAEIATKLANSGLRDPQVTVVLKNARLRQAFALGAVTRPGPYPFGVGVRLTELLAAAGGLTVNPNEATANLMRGTQVLVVDLQGALTGAKPDANLLLEENDVLWVQELPKIAVVVAGLVNKPGVYRMKDTCAALDALAAAGDINDPTREGVIVTLMRGQASQTIDVAAALIDPRKNPLLHDGDTLWVQPAARMTAVVAGEVQRPGAVKLRPGSTFLDALAAAGDTTLAKGDLFATLMREGKIVPIDLRKALAGDPAANPAVRENDVFWVQSLARMTVLVSGQVKNPGSFKLKDAARVVDAVVAAGDLTMDRGELAATLVRGTTALPVDLRAAFQGATPDANPLLREGDVLWIQPLARMTVVVSGMVKTPGAVKLKDGANTLDAIAAAGGVPDEHADLVVTRMRANDTASMSLQAVLAGRDVEARKPLKDGDVLWVQPLTKTTVVVAGAVRTPGSFRLRMGSTFTDAIAAAGDINIGREEAVATLMRGTQVIPVNLTAAWLGVDLRANPVLQEGDVIWIQQMVRMNIVVSGQVKNPGAYRLKPGSTFMDAVAAAGDMQGAADEVTATLMRGTQLTPVNLAAALRDPTKNPVLQDSDVAWIQPLARLTVLVSGAVKNPGAYRLREAGTVVDAIVASGDLLVDRKELTASLVRGTQVTPVDLAAAFADPRANPKLQDGDVLSIQSRNTLTIVLSGQVKNPGAIKLKADAVVLDALAAAGDFTAERSDLVVSIMRGNETFSMSLLGALNGVEPDGKKPLREGDVIWIQPLTKVSVVVSGLVKAPGSYRLRVGSSVLDALAAAADLSVARDEAVVTLMRGAKTIIVDLRAALANPDANPRLQDGDLLWVQPAAKLTVVVSGQVKIPGAYKLKTDATVLDALAAAGDVNGEMRELSATLMRGADTLAIDLAGAVSGVRAANLKLHEGDVIWVQPMVKYSVVVAGQVAKPGPLRIRAGSTVLQALAEAGDIVGVREDLAATLMRGETRIVVDLRKALLTPTANPVLQDGDVLFVQPVPKLGIVVAGAVKNPGAYRLPQGCTVVDALAAAADVSVRPERARITLVRNGARQAVTWGSARTPLQDADIILVEQEPVLRVYLNGQVKLPGAYELPEGSGVLQALALAGGATDAAALDNVTIVRAATNTQEKVSLTAALSGLQGANPVLQSGDQIIVPTSTASVAIFGNVARPGQYPISPFAPMRITDAVAQAGSMDKDSNPAGTMIIRVVEGKTQLIPADMSNLIKMARVTLMPGDIVYVPKAGNKTNWRDVLDSLYRVGVLVSVL